MPAPSWVDVDLDDLQVLDADGMYLDDSDDEERSHLEVEGGDLSGSELDEDEIPEDSPPLGDEGGISQAEFAEQVADLERNLYELSFHHEDN